MAFQTVESKSIVDAVQSLVDRFRLELTGARQATRTQLVDFLARKLKINQNAAAKLFDDLREAGVIVRGDEGLDDAHLPGRDDQSWEIDASHSAVLAVDATVDADVAEKTESPALTLIRRAIRHRATDIHLDPFDDEIEVRLRIDGQLEHYCRLSESIGKPLLQQLKVMAGLDPAEHFQALEGRLSLPTSISHYDVRITATPVINGEAVSLRLLRRDQIIRSLDSLGLATADLHDLRQRMGVGEGMILVGGPAGSGKTTTLYSLVYHLDNGRRNIVTIEDPVEYFVPGFSQIQVDTRHKMSLAAGLKTALRMDPDILLLGEIRDTETAAAAMRAASCGKFVFTTFHTRDAASVVTASRDLQVDQRSLASSLRAVISQRLVRRLCEHCRDTRATTDTERVLFEQEAIDVPERLPRAVGCKHCHGSGYHERTGVFEIVVATPEIADAIEQGKGERELREILRQANITSLTKDGLRKVRNGITTLEEVKAMYGFAA
ncbi:GspE/PulE family protein [Novipirellula sp. SH528]|uniref:GspE/PulE family protein n=1 Tax=Novipirellula sp. SH528 TaxID=3454466 RepID=UPI003FA064A8